MRCHLSLKLQNLPPVKSDHHPLLFDLQSDLSRHSRDLCSLKRLDWLILTHKEKVWWVCEGKLELRGGLVYYKKEAAFFGEWSSINLIRSLRDSPLYLSKRRLKLMVSSLSFKSLQSCYFSYMLHTCKSIRHLVKNEDSRDRERVLAMFDCVGRGR